MRGKPLWRRAYDAVERSVALPLETFVRTDEFARATALAVRVRRTVRDQANSTSTRLWHLANLPAGTDVQRLRVQIGQLDREVRRLRLQLAVQAQSVAKEVNDGAAEPEERA